MNKKKGVDLEHVLIQYLGNFLPADDSDQSPVLKSSQDISDELSTMVELSINRISITLLELGYKTRLGADGLPRCALMKS